MGIQVGFYDEVRDDFEGSEEFFSYPEFFYFAEILSKAGDALRSTANPETDDYRAAFLSFLGEERAENEKLFGDYCEFVNELRRTLAASTKTAPPDATDEPHAGEFDPDVRAFLGRLMLSDEPVTPQSAGRLFYASLWVAGVLRSLAMTFEEEAPEASEHLRFAAGKVEQIAHYAERCLEDSRSFKFAC